jgi:hypothetical protein
MNLRKRFCSFASLDYGSATRVASAREKQVASFFRLNGRQRSDARNDTPSAVAKTHVQVRNSNFAARLTLSDFRIPNACTPFRQPDRHRSKRCRLSASPPALAVCAIGDYSLQSDQPLMKHVVIEVIPAKNAPGQGKSGDQ